jgi:hypothetical protein
MDSLWTPQPFYEGLCRHRSLQVRQADGIFRAVYRQRWSVAIVKTELRSFFALVGLGSKGLLTPLMGQGSGTEGSLTVVVEKGL